MILLLLNLLVIAFRMSNKSKFTSLFSTDFYSTKYNTFGIKYNAVQNGEHVSKFANISKASRSWSNGEMKTTWNKVCIPQVGWHAFMAAVATVDKLISEPAVNGNLTLYSNLLIIIKLKFL